MKKSFLIFSLMISYISFSQTSDPGVTSTASASGNHAFVGTYSNSTFSNWLNTGDSATNYNLLGYSQKYAGFGVANGNNIVSPIIWMYENPKNAFRVRTMNYNGDMTIGTDLFTVRANGKVGIGTTNPSAGIQIEKAIPVDFIASLKNTDTGASSNGLKVEVSNSSTNNTVQRWLVNNSEIMRVRADGNVGIGTTNPSEKLHVNGNIGIGAMSGTNEEGFRVDYLDGGSGTTTFKSNRWGGDIYFKRNSSLGERNQFLFGGASNHYMNIYDNNNQVKVRLISSGNSYINGGNVGIGTTTPDSKLSVNGNIHTKEVKVDLIGWSDFVFEDDYQLPTLKEVEQHIKEKGHLQDIPSAKEVSENGILLGEMDSKLLQKIEELTLYTINQEKRIESLEEKNETLIELVKKLISQIEE